MRLFTLPRWTRCLQVLCIALVILVSFQLLTQAKGKERNVPWIPDRLPDDTDRWALHLL
jgi:hypothetical protein